MSIFDAHICAYVVSWVVKNVALRRWALRSELRGGTVEEEILCLPRYRSRVRRIVGAADPTYRSQAELAQYLTDDGMKVYSGGPLP